MNFKSWRDFDNFEKEVKHKARYIHSEYVNEFLSNIKKTLPYREKILPRGYTLFRSQIGYDEYDDEGTLVITGLPKERMKPTPSIGHEGRVNPKGISYLYLSSDRDTSMSELRPHLNELISSAQFETNKDLRLVDCYSTSKNFDYVRCIFAPPTSQEDIDDTVWSTINSAFTRPINNNQSSADYVPTQILAELFKSEGFDGVFFKSSLGKGYNFSLFSLETADLISCTAMQTNSVSYSFSECGSRYSIQRMAGTNP